MTSETFFSYITKLGDSFFIIVIFLFVGYFLWCKDKSSLKYFVAVFFFNEVLVYLIKFFVGRPRPLGALKYGEFGRSFPSGHATVSIFLFGYISYLLIKFYKNSLRRNMAIASLWTLIFLIGFSRFYLDVHYLSDVLGGYLLGGTSLFLLIKLTKSSKLDWKI